MFHLKDYPKIEYNNANIQDITFRIKIREYVQEKVEYFLPYLIQDGETAESLAFDFWGDMKLAWVIRTTNDIIDPLHDWPMDYNTFIEFLKNKYLEYPELAYDWHHFEDANGTEIPEPESDVDKHRFGISVLDYEISQYSHFEDDDGLMPDPITEELQERYGVTFKEYEENRNEDNRKVFVIKEEFIPQFKVEIKRLLKEYKNQ